MRLRFRFCPQGIRRVLFVSSPLALSGVEVRGADSACADMLAEKIADDILMGA